VKKKQAATVYTCDAPKCAKQFVALDPRDLPEGFHGTVIATGHWGAAGGAWFACTINHVLAAIDAVIERSRS
jgi:hypothetical protein